MNPLRTSVVEKLIFIVNYGSNAEALKAIEILHTMGELK